MDSRAYHTTARIRLKDHEIDNLITNYMRLD